MSKSSDSASYGDDWGDDYYESFLSGLARGDYDVPHISMSEMLVEPTKKNREDLNKNRVRQLQRNNGKSFTPKPPRRVQGR